MAEFGKISWKGSASPNGPVFQMDAHKAYSTFLDMAQARFPDTSLLKSCSNFEKERGNIKTAHSAFLSAISREPFAAAFITWIKDIAYQQTTVLDSARALLENDLIGTYDIEGNLWTIGMAHGFDQKKILSSVRCKRNWSNSRRETVVQTYLDFIHWLSAQTYGYITDIQDPDLQSIKNRKLPFNQFIEFLDAIPNEKSQLVAKLLYFGGSRNLEEILELQILSVKFSSLEVIWNTYDLSSGRTGYPEHVFNDFKALIGNRETGLIFLGRQEAPLNDATVFRHFNEAAKKVGLGESFGPKKLVANLEERISSAI